LSKVAARVFGTPSASVRTIFGADTTDCRGVGATVTECSTAMEDA
jgi:hypothetical protein